MPEQALLLFGYPQVTVDGQVVDIKSRKGLALLAYLAVAGIPQSRDLVAGLLWPEYNQTRARANLRRTLFNLNRTVAGDWLVSDGELLSLRAEIRDVVDAVRFQALTVSGAVDDLETAAEIYRDEFLAGYHLPDSQPFEEWAGDLRAQLGREMLEALERLAQHDLDEGEFDQAIARARRQLEWDNLRESAWRQLMTALARTGQRAEALAEFERCRQILANELDVEPSEATIALVDSIRGNSPGIETNVAVHAAQIAAEDDPRAAEMPILVPGSPYRGLFAFREDDAELFFGREELTEMLVGHVHTQPIVAVIGPSGSGKTSVVYAGLVAQLRNLDGWQIASFRPGMDPYQGLSTALTPLLVDGAGPVDQLVEARKLASALHDDDLSLHGVIARIRQHQQVEHLLLVADQFEELYTLCPDPELRQRFLNHLLDLVFSQQYLSEPIFSLVLTLRADFLAQALSHRGFADAIQESDVKLGPMSRPELTRAILKPAERHGAHFEPGLVTRMLDDVGDEPGNLPLLEFALDTLWSRQQAALLRHETYEGIGRVEGALARYADEVFLALAEEEQLTARRLFTQLVQPGEGTEDTRRVATHRDLGDEGWALASRLADARLVITGLEATGQQTAEVVHEALIRCWDRLRNWMSEDREFRIWQERLRASERQWQANAQDDGSLLRGVALSTAEGWLESSAVDIGADERAFIEASIALRERRQAEAEAASRRFSQLQRRLVYTLALGLLLALILAGVAGLQWRQANKERLKVEAQSRVALSRQLAAQSGTQLDHGHLDLAHLLAVEAVHLDRNPESRAALRAAVSQPDSMIRKFVGHEGSVLSAVWSDDGLKVLTTSDDGTARVWDAGTGEQLLVLEGHTGWLAENAEASWSPDGRWILTAGEEDETVRVWDASTGVVRHVLDGANTFVNWIEWSPDGSRILAVGDNVGEVWDAATGELLTTFTQHNDFIQQGHWNRDGSRVITNSADHTARVWDPQSGEQLLVLAGHDDGVIRARWSPDESRILTAGIDGALKVWDTATGVEMLTLVGHDDFIWEARWNRDGSRILTSSADGLAKIWDATTGELLQTFTGHESVVWDAIWSPDEQMVATAGGEDGSARIWDAATGEEIARFGHSNSVGSVRWRSDGRAVLTAGDFNEPMLWAVGAQPTRTFLPELRGSPVSYHSGEWSQDDRLILAASEDPRATVILWDTVAGGVVRSFSGLRASEIALFSEDASQVLAAGWDGAVYTWATRTGAPLLMLNRHADAVWEVSWDVDEKRILSAGEDGTARISDAQTGEELLIYRGHGDEIWEAVWNPDDRRVATGSKDGTVHIWDSETGETLVVLEQLDSGVGHIEWNQDGDRLLTGDESGNARVWDTQTGALIFELAGHTPWLTSGGWNGDGARILTVGGDAARIWDAESGDLLLTLPGDGNRVDFGLWSSDDSQVALAVDTVGIQLWDARSGELLEQIPVDRYTDRLQWSHDGNRLAAMGNEGIRQYLMDVDEMIDIACQRAGRPLSEEEWHQYVGETQYAATCDLR